MFDLIYMPMPAACGAQTDIRDGSTALWTFINYKRTMLALALALGAGFLPDSQTARHGQRTTMTGPKQRPTLMSQENGASRNKR